MRFRIADENVAAERLIPPTAPDNSGIGINYADAYIKPFNMQVEGGPKIACKRKGLKIVLTIDGSSGEAIMRRADHGPDVRVILRRALESAAERAGGRMSIEDGGVFLET